MDIYNLNMNLHNLEAIVLAGGKGERMKSDTPKVLHQINGKPMIFYTLEKLIKLGIKNIIVVVGYKAGVVKKSIKSFVPEIFQKTLGACSDHLGGVHLKFAKQKELFGTADALKAALEKLNPETVSILVLNGDDSAFYSIETLRDFIESQPRGRISVITAIKPDAEIGRIIRDQDGNFEKILEFSEYQESSSSSDEINCGTYLFELSWLKKNLNKVQKNPQKGEYYLTEALNIAKNMGEQINLFQLKDPDEWMGINTQEDLERANLLLKS